jgi:hypothetical protein
MNLCLVATERRVVYIAGCGDRTGYLTRPIPGLISAIDKTPKFIFRQGYHPVSTPPDANDTFRYFNVSEISSDLECKPDARSVLQMRLWRFVYAEHIVPDSSFPIALH